MEVCQSADSECQAPFSVFLFFGVCFLAGQCEVMWRGGGICEEKESKKGNRFLKGFVGGC